METCNGSNPEVGSAGFIGDVQDSAHIPIENATKAFISDAEVRKLKDKTICKYKLLFTQLSAFVQEQGLRFLGDALSWSVDRLADGKLRLYTQKTGTHVHCPLPDFVVRELARRDSKEE